MPARVLGALYHSGGASVSAQFMSTGAIAGPDLAWHDLFATPARSGASLSGDKAFASRMLRSYLDRAGMRGPVDGWSRLWL